MGNYITTSRTVYVSGAVILAANHNNNENEIYSQHNAAFNNSTGHGHTGATGDGPKLTSSGINLTGTFAWTGAHTHTANFSLYSGADFGIYSDAGSTAKFFVDGATGDFGIATGRKFFLDGASLAGNTYIEGSSSVINFYTAAYNYISIRSSQDPRVLIQSADAAIQVCEINAGSASFTSNVLRLSSGTTAASTYNFLTAISAGNDAEFILRGDGIGYSDGGWTTPAADYAEYFESIDGSELEVGRTVILQGGKVRYAVGNEIPMGVVRPKKNARGAGIVGNDGALKWSRKYLKDEFGRYEMVDGARKLNPEYNPENEYIPREDRAEWAIIGLLGQVPVKKNEPLNPNWILMSEGIVANIYLIK